MAERTQQRPVSATRLLIWSLIAVFFVQIFSVGNGGAIPSAFDLRFGLSARSLGQGHWWTLLTYGWLHSEQGVPWGLLWNVLWLNLLGPSVEAALGKKRFLGLYLGSLFAGAVVWRLCGSSGSLLIGASGAVFGLLAAYSRLPQSGGMLLLQMLIRSFFRFAVGFEVVCILLGWLPGTAHWAHLGGAFGGWWFMHVFGPKVVPASSAAGATFQTPPQADAPRPAERNAPEAEGLFSNYNSTPQPPEGS